MAEVILCSHCGRLPKKAERAARVTQCPHCKTVQAVDSSGARFLPVVASLPRPRRAHASRIRPRSAPTATRSPSLRAARTRSPCPPPVASRSWRRWWLPIAGIALFAPVAIFSAIQKPIAADDASGALAVAPDETPQEAHASAKPRASDLPCLLPKPSSHAPRPCAKPFESPEVGAGRLARHKPSETPPS